MADPALWDLVGSHTDAETLANLSRSSQFLRGATEHRRLYKANKLRQQLREPVEQQQTVTELVPVEQQQTVTELVLNDATIDAFYTVLYDVLGRHASDNNFIRHHYAMSEMYGWFKPDPKSKRNVPESARVILNIHCDGFAMLQLKTESGIQAEFAADLDEKQLNEDKVKHMTAMDAFMLLKQIGARFNEGIETDANPVTANEESIQRFIDTVVESLVDRFYDPDPGIRASFVDASLTAPPPATCTAAP